MNSTWKSRVLAGVAMLAALPASWAAKTTAPDLTPLQNKVRHELVMLPYFSIFDNLSFRVDGQRVTLLGQVTRPVLKSDAGNVVKHIAGVESVDNQIQVLPLSPFDDQTRRAEARAIYGYGPLQRYALGAQPPIRIIVNNGHVTLEGVVANEMDRNLVNIRANQVPGVFSVTNNLRVENARRSES